MNLPAPDSAQRTRALIETGLQEAQYLQRRDDRLFAQPLGLDAISRLPQNDDLSERIDAFVARFGRLQDTIGDKLLPAFLGLMQETPATMLENLDRAERLKLIDSADEWLAIRKLRNRMIHEYVRTPTELLDALNAAHQFIPALIHTLHALIRTIAQHFPEIPPDGAAT
ncbi:MAG: hypothetical protein ACOY42_02980 [Pseudomonadota bacterium]